MAGRRVGYVQTVIVRRTDGECGWQVLLLKRAKDQGGYWQPVTGHIKTGEVPPAAALRELEEETGFGKSSIRRFVDPEYNFEYSAMGVDLIEHVFGVEVSPDVVPVLSDEHTEARWTRLKEALRLIHWASNKASVAHVFSSMAGAPCC